MLFFKRSDGNHIHEGSRSAITATYILVYFAETVQKCSQMDGDPASLLIVDLFPSCRHCWWSHINFLCRCRRHFKPTLVVRTPAANLSESPALKPSVFLCFPLPGHLRLCLWIYQLQSLYGGKRNTTLQPAYSTTHTTRPQSLHPQTRRIPTHSSHPKPFQ